MEKYSIDRTYLLSLIVNRKSEKFVFLAICTKPAIAILPSGENAHCTVEPIEWWKTMIEKYAPKRVYTHLKTYGHCNNYEILNEDLYLEWYIRQIDTSFDLHK